MKIDFSGETIIFTKNDCLDAIKPSRPAPYCNTDTKGAHLLSPFLF